ncbi:hypothetical protein [Methylomonas koyamae]|nr:hypothetical protein [Methylomonas koyamae]
MGFLSESVGVVTEDGYEMSRDLRYIALYAGAGGRTKKSVIAGLAAADFC